MNIISRNCVYSFVFLCRSSMEPGFVSTAAAGAAGVSGIDDGGASAACTFPILSKMTIVVDLANDYFIQYSAIINLRHTHQIKKRTLLKTKIVFVC